MYTVGNTYLTVRPVTGTTRLGETESGNKEINTQSCLESSVDILRIVT